MAKLDIDYRANELRTLLQEGKKKNAVEYAQKHLRAGYSSAKFLALIADMLEPAPRGPGRPSKTPPYWCEIGVDYQNLLSDGVTNDAARQKLSAKYGQSESSIRDAFNYYKKALDSLEQDI